MNYNTSDDIWSNSANRNTNGGNPAPRRTAYSSQSSQPQRSRYSSQQPPQRNSKPPRKKRRNTGRIVFNIILSAILVVAIATAGIGYALAFGKFEQETVKDENGSVVSVESNIKLKGSSHPDCTYFLVVGTDEEELLTDIILVVCFDHGTGTASILQIPRDTFISLDVPSGKVNAVHAFPERNQTGIEALADVIDRYFGLPIDYYFEFTIDCFRKVIDSMGGIDVQVDVEMDAWTKYDEWYTFEPGLNHFDGSMAEAFVRHRNSYASGDVGRVEAQRNFYAAFANKLINMSYSNMASIASSCYNDIKTNLSFANLLSYAKTAQKLTLDNILISAVPGTSGYYRELSYFSAYTQDYCDLINAYFKPYDNIILTPDDIELVELFGETGESVIKGETTFSEIMNKNNNSEE